MRGAGSGGASGTERPSAREVPKRELERYREGFADGLRWVLERFNLDTEDEDALNEVLTTGRPWE